MTPEDWQRLWHGHEGGGPRNSRADLLVRAQMRVNDWQKFRWFYVVSVMFVLIAGIHLYAWTRTGSGITLALAVAHVGFGMLMAANATTLRRAARQLPPVVTVVEFYRQLLETERRRLRRFFVPVAFVVAAQVSPAIQASASLAPSVRTRLTLGFGSVDFLGVVFWYAVHRLDKQLDELKGSPGDM
jgi:hypothetical protein